MGGQGLVFNPGAFTNYFGPREVFITRAFFNPIWTLRMYVGFIIKGFSPFLGQPLALARSHVALLWSLHTYVHSYTTVR